MDKIDKS